MDVSTRARQTRIGPRLALLLVACCGCPGLAAAGSGVQPVADIATAAGREALRLAQGDASGIRVEEARVDPRLRLERCSGPLAARAAQGARAGGRMTIEVSCRAPRWRVFVPVTLTARLPVAVAARPLAARTALSATDLRMAERDLHSLPQGYFTALEDAVGLELTRALGAGETLTPGAVRHGSLVRRGQQVILLARGEGISVRMKGEALADGGLNQRVRVRNLSSGREIEGVVRSADVVEVAL